MSKYKFGIMHLPIKTYLKWWLDKQAQEVDYNKTFYLGKSEQDSTTGANLANIDEALRTNIVIKDGNNYKIIKSSSGRFSNKMNVDISAGTINFQINVIASQITGRDVYYLGMEFIYEDDSIGYMNFNDINIMGFHSFRTVVTKKIKSIRFYLDGEYDNNSYVIVNNFMVSYGTEAGTYEPYTGGIPSPNPIYPQPIINLEGNLHFRKNKDFYFTLSEGQKLMQDGKIEDKVINEWNETEFDGSNDEAWNFNGSAGGNSTFFIKLNDAINFNDNTDNITRVYCNKFVGTSASDIVNNTSAYKIAIISNKRLYLILGDNTITTRAGMQSYLAENPIKVQYRLLEPDETPFTNTQLQQYRKLCEAFPNGTNLNDYLV